MLVDRQARRRRPWPARAPAAARSRARRRAAPRRPLPATGRTTDRPVAPRSSPSSRCGRAIVSRHIAPRRVTAMRNTSPLADMLAQRQQQAPQQALRRARATARNDGARRRYRPRASRRRSARHCSSSAAIGGSRSDRARRRAAAAARRPGRRAAWRRSRDPRPRRAIAAPGRRCSPRARGSGGAPGPRYWPSMISAKPMMALSGVLISWTISRSASRSGACLLAARRAPRRRCAARARDSQGSARSPDRTPGTPVALHSPASVSPIASGTSTNGWRWPIRAAACRSSRPTPSPPSGRPTSAPRGAPSTQAIWPEASLSHLNRRGLAGRRGAARRRRCRRGRGVRFARAARCGRPCR